MWPSAEYTQHIKLLAARMKILLHLIKTSFCGGSIVMSVMGSIKLFLFPCSKQIYIICKCSYREILCGWMTKIMIRLKKRKYPIIPIYRQIGNWKCFIKFYGLFANFRNGLRKHFKLSGERQKEFIIFSY